MHEDRTALHGRASETRSGIAVCCTGGVSKENGDRVDVQLSMRGRM